MDAAGGGLETTSIVLRETAGNFWSGYYYPAERARFALSTRRYPLLSVTLINWALATHNLAEAGNLGGDTALIGLNRFGKPMLYAIYVTTLKGR